MRIQHVHFLFFFSSVPPGKNSADFILSHRAGMLDWVLPVTVPFNIISSDHGFDVIVQDLKRPVSFRKTNIQLPLDQTA